MIDINKFIYGMKNRYSHMHKLKGRVTIILFAVAIFISFIIGAILYILYKMGFSPLLLGGSFIVLFLMLTLCMILVSIISIFMMRNIFQPIERLSRASNRIAKGIFDVHIDYGGNIEELNTTIENFNNMVKELNSVEMLRTDFITNVSHEFKTPLSSIKGYVTLLQDPDLSGEEKNEYIRRVFLNIAKLDDLTGNILMISKLENQEYESEIAPYRIDEQIREAIVILEPEWSAKKINLDIDLPEIFYTGNEPLLFQVWMNILSNAIKYVDEGGNIAVILSKNGDNITVEVSDNGIGISEETLPHIFDKFYQGEHSEKSYGNGLGLALCLEILKHCNGEISAESTAGKGSIFIVQLSSNI